MNVSILAIKPAPLFLNIFRKSCESSPRRFFFSRIGYSVALMLIAQSVAPGMAYAYIDPNTGGYFFQILFPVISTVVAVYLFFKNQVMSFYAKLTGLFKKKKDGGS